MRTRFLVITSLQLLIIPFLFAGSKFPKPNSWVSDFANVLTPNDRKALEFQIDSFKQKTGTEIAMVTIESLEGDSVENYANELFTEWGIGQKGKDNGILILLAVQDRQTRIEVGYGLEGVLNDGRVGEIIRNDMIPAFKNGNYGLGFQNALDSIERYLSGVQVSSPDETPQPDRPNNEEKKSPFRLLVYVLFLMMRILPFTAIIAICVLMLPMPLWVKIISGLTLPFALWFDLQLMGSGGWFGGSGGFGGGGGGFGGFGGGSSGGGGASGRW